MAIQCCLYFISKIKTISKQSSKRQGATVERNVKQIKYALVVGGGSQRNTKRKKGSSCNNVWIRNFTLLTSIWSLLVTKSSVARYSRLTVSYFTGGTFPHPGAILRAREVQRAARRYSLFLSATPEENLGCKFEFSASKKILFSTEIKIIQ